MLECKLRLVKTNTESKDTVSEGVVDTESMRLEGYDEDYRIEWTLTLKTKEGIPDHYKSLVGEHIGDSVIASLGSSAQQANLEA